MDEPLNDVGKVSGHVAIMGAGPGDPELITMKAIRLLKEADVVLYDRLCNPAILEYTRTGATLLNVGKNPGKPSFKQEHIQEILIQEALKGHFVVRLKGGDPFVFGRGGEECLELAKYGIPFQIVPGVSSISAVPAYAGIPLTMRNLATGFTVISGHLHCGSYSYDWHALASVSTLVVLMGLKSLPEISRSLMDNGKSPETPVAVIQWGTTQDQNVVSGSLLDIADKAAAFTSPATIIIGDVVRYRDSLQWFHPEHHLSMAGTLTASAT
ncbi:uroporphyrinogen-III C-methyltransferase [Balneolaceae bacterium ANBcel3]|nr:uroporphyrinogen-III C-methyltransferase [Balneolaceae bacterium ANBcel3]